MGADMVRTPRKEQEKALEALKEGKPLSEKIVKSLPTPEKGNKVYYDSTLRGFGVRVTAKDTRSFVYNYRTKTTGRERRYTIGQWGRSPNWSVTAARKEAGNLKKVRDTGGDPMGAIHASRSEPTVADLAERYIDEQLPKKRPSTQRDYRDMINKFILPELKHLKVAEVNFADTDGLHRKITRRGNRKLPSTRKVQF